MPHPASDSCPYLFKPVLSVPLGVIKLISCTQFIGSSPTCNNWILVHHEFSKRQALRDPSPFQPGHYKPDCHDKPNSPSLVSGVPNGKQLQGDAGEI